MQAVTVSNDQVSSFLCHRFLLKGGGYALSWRKLSKIRQSMLSFELDEDAPTSLDVL